MANMFLMNGVPLFLSHFLHLDFLPLGFNEQELSEEVRRNFVIYTLRRVKLKAYMYIHEHAYMCAYICMYLYAHMYIYVCMHVPCVHMCAYVQLWACVCVYTLNIHWFILYPQDVSEGIKDTV